MVPKKDGQRTPFPSAVKRKKNNFGGICVLGCNALGLRNTSAHRMRIIGGIAGGMTLKVPKGLGVRPTPDKVRLAIFNSLGPTVEDARVLEEVCRHGRTWAGGLESRCCVCLVC